MSSSKLEVQVIEGSSYWESTVLVCVLQPVLGGGLTVVKSSRLLAKSAAYLVSISQLLCLAFLCRWRFLKKIPLDWPLTLTTQPSTSKLSDNPVGWKL